MKEEIHPTQHCLLCRNQSHSKMNGVICGLTKEKPTFGKFCSSFQEEDELPGLVASPNLGLEIIQRSKPIVIGHLILYLIIGLIIIVSGFLIGKYAFDNRVISTVPLIIMGVGVCTLPISLAPWISFRQKLGVAMHRKEVLDQVLSEYGIRYNIHFRFGKKFLNRRDVTTSLEITKGHQTISNEELTFPVNTDLFSFESRRRV